MNKKEIGDRIKKSLECKGMSQRQLADSLDMTEVSISRYIRGQRIPSAQIIGRIANAIGVTTDYLITGKVEPTKHVEMIIDYITDGSDYQYSDNKGILVRCRDCKWWGSGNVTIECSWDLNEHDAPSENDYCSKAMKRE